MRRGYFFAAIAAICLVVAPLGAHAQAPEKPKLSIGVGGKPLFYYLPLTIAERNGYFKAEGLEVEILDFPGGARALQALLGGSVDVVSGAYEHTISQQAKGQNIEALILQGKDAGIVLGMSKAKAAQYKSGKDLKGMKIGVTAPGSSTNMFVNVLLAKDGLKPDDVAIIGVGATAGAVAIMKRGEIDAIANLDPVISMLEAGGDIVPVIDTRTPKGMQDVYGGAYAAGCIYVPVDFAKKYPNTAQASSTRSCARCASSRRRHPIKSSRRCRPSTTRTRRCTRPRSRRTSIRTSTTDRSRSMPGVTCCAISRASTPPCRTRRSMSPRR